MTSQLDRSPSNLVAARTMSAIQRTLQTFQPERSLSKLVAPKNMPPMSVTLPTFPPTKPLHVHPAPRLFGRGHGRIGREDRTRRHVLPVGIHEETQKGMHAGCKPEAYEDVDAPLVRGGVTRIKLELARAWHGQYRGTEGW